MSLICAVPSYADMSAETGQDVIVINGGHTATRLRLDKVVPIARDSALFFRAVLSNDSDTPVREGIHLSRVGDFLVRLHLARAVAEDGTEVYEAHAQAHLDEMEIIDRVTRPQLVAV